MTNVTQSLIFSVLFLDKTGAVLYIVHTSPEPVDFLPGSIDSISHLAVQPEAVSVGEIDLSDNAGRSNAKIYAYKDSALMAWLKPKTPLNEIYARIHIFNQKDGSATCVFAGYCLQIDESQKIKSELTLSGFTNLPKKVDTGFVLSSMCPHRFKGHRCKYSGAETDCDKTIQRCAELGNTVNHGGFPFLSFDEDKTNGAPQLPEFR